MISNESSWDQHITECRWATLTTQRRSGSPVSSIVAYARDGDELVVSTPGPTFKAKSIERDPKVNLLVFNNSEPFNYVSIEGHASVETEDLERRTHLVFEAITGTGYEEPDDLAGWIEQDKRVIIRITPDRVFGVIR